MRREVFHPILSCNESKAFEEQLFGNDKTAEAEAMQSAGIALGKSILNELGKRLRASPDVLLVIGKGHNAGDTIIASQFLLRNIPALQIDILPLFGLDSFDWIVESEMNNLREFDAVSIVDRNDESIFSVNKVYGLMLDGVFGMQFHPPLSEELAVLFEKINRLNIDVRVAVDLPSGICEESVPVALRSDFTYATGLLKKPLLIAENRKWCGRIRYLDIGFFDHEPRIDPFPSSHLVFAPELLRQSCSLRNSESDKRDYGHLLIVAGSKRMPGAMLMAVKASVKSGVGLVTVIAPESVVVSASISVPEAMWIPWPETTDGWISEHSVNQLIDQFDRFTAVLAGPGLGRNPGTRRMLKSIFEQTEVPVVLDADALQKEIVDSVATETRSREVVLTPHQGEYKRLWASGMENLEKSLNPSFCVVRKGPFTRIEHNNKTYFSPHGGPVLARGGSGDILAGLVAGKVANPQIPGLLESVASAVLIHGSAADKLASACDENHVNTTQLLEYIS